MLCLEISSISLRFFSAGYSKIGAILSGFGLKSSRLTSTPRNLTSLRQNSLFSRLIVRPASLMRVKTCSSHFMCSSNVSETMIISSRYEKACGSISGPIILSDNCWNVAGRPSTPYGIRVNSMRLMPGTAKPVSYCTEYLLYDRLGWLPLPPDSRHPGRLAWGCQVACIYRGTCWGL